MHDGGGGGDDYDDDAPVAEYIKYKIDNIQHANVTAKTEMLSQIDQSVNRYLDSWTC